jgi:carbamoyltransferase
MTGPKFHELFGGPPRAANEPLTQHHMDLAASIQAATERIVLQLARAIRAETGMRKLCLAGGVALNCVANGKLLRDGQFDDIWIQPAAGDAGGALGAALAVHHIHLGQSRSADGSDRMRGSYLGPEFAQADIERRLTAAGAKFQVLGDAELYQAGATALAEEKALGWFQGRMEFGPRALGGRSILGDARSPAMQSVLNLKVKYRESFRPFAPAVLREDVADWFELDGDSPYMLLVADVVEKRRRQMTEGRTKAFRHREAECAALGHPGRDPCRLFGAHPDRACRNQSALSRPDLRLQAADRLPGDREHQLQRPRRAHRLYPRRCFPLLHGHRDRSPRRGQLLPEKGRPGSGSQTEL